MAKEILVVHKGGGRNPFADIAIADYRFTFASSLAGANDLLEGAFYHMIFVDGDSLGIKSYSQVQPLKEKSSRSVFVLMFEPQSNVLITPASPDIDTALLNEQCLLLQKPFDVPRLLAQVEHTRKVLLKNKENTVLIVEDTEALLETFIPILEEGGYIVTGVTNGTDALKELAAHSFATVVSDYRLPDMTGLDVINKVKQIDPSVSIIFMTGFSDIEDIKKSLQGKVIDFLSKPIDIARLYAALEKAKAARNAALEKA